MNTTNLPLHILTTKKEEWKYYKQRFELEITLSGIENNKPDLKRNLLLKWIGAEVFKIVADNFDPNQLLK